jgi:hypothetical protein
VDKRHFQSRSFEILTTADDDASLLTKKSAQLDRNDYDRASFAAR